VVIRGWENELVYDYGPLKPKNLKPNWSAVDALNKHDILHH